MASFNEVRIRYKWAETERVLALCARTPVLSSPVVYAPWAGDLQVDSGEWAGLPAVVRVSDNGLWSGAFRCSGGLHIVHSGHSSCVARPVGSVGPVAASADDTGTAAQGVVGVVESRAVVVFPALEPPRNHLACAAPREVAQRRLMSTTVSDSIVLTASVTSSQGGNVGA